MMDPQLDTAQRRADSERLKAHELLKRIVGIVPMTPEQRCARIDWLMEYAQQARRDALAEAAKMVLSYGAQARDEDLPGGYTAELAAHALDRLREGVQGGTI